MQEDAYHPDAGTALTRRGMIATGGAVALGTLAAAAIAHPAAAAEQPAIDASFKDFTLPKFQCDDSLIKVQKRG
ncbi:MAG: hypothetical protein ACREFP_21870, partial [Acetobacteraceae bacterium]